MDEETTSIMIKLKDILEEIFKGAVPRFLYHGTFGAHLNSIKTHGIVKGGKGVVNYDWDFDEDRYGVFLANDAQNAYSFVETSENEKEIPEEWFDDIIVLVIDTYKLDRKLFIKDPHVTYSAGSLTDKKHFPKSFIYQGTIPFNAIIKIQDEYGNPVT